MKIIEIVILIIASVLSVSWIYGVRKYVTSGLGITRQTVNTAMLFVSSIILTLVFSWSPLNLLWIFPLSWILGTLSLAFPISLLWVPGKYFAQICTIGINNKQTDIQKEIDKLTKEVELENSKNSVLFKKYENDTEAMNNFPEFTDPKIIVPQTCKRQLIVYLKSKILGRSDIDSFHDVLWSRFDNNPTNDFKIKASDFKEIINKRGLTISDLCKEIIRKENPDQNPEQLNYLDSLVNKYFHIETT